MHRFDEEAGYLGLHVLWAKTKIQNVGHGAALPALSVGASTVDSVSEFIYLGSKISSEGYITPEVMRRIALAASAINQLGRFWRQRNLSLAPSSVSMRHASCQYFSTAPRHGPA